jgi:4-diphosphocytidyl-2-C-methyl-D-erythritol kinase
MAVEGGGAAPSEAAPAKVNLTLRVLRRRPDGYHDIESLVVFAALGDSLTFAVGRTLTLAVRGPTAAAAGTLGDNLVVKAAHALAARVPGLKLGRFVLTKRLPVAAGLGGGSADAAAALRLMARANRIRCDDPRLLAAARATGADVPVCLDPRPRVMRGTGEILSEALELPTLPAVLINPGVAVPTREVFAALRLPPDVAGNARSACDHAPIASGRATLLARLRDDRNDLEPPAIALQPVIAEVLAAVRASAGCALARMSGSGATCFGLFDSARAATAAAQALRSAHAHWWIRATVLAGVGRG